MKMGNHPRSTSPRSRRAALSDLLIAYAVIVILAVVAYLYFTPSFPPHIFNVQISQQNYRNSLNRRDMDFIGGHNQWGEGIQTYHVGGLAVGVAMNKHDIDKELTQEEIDLLPVEAYLGDVKRPATCDGCFKFNVKPVIENNVCASNNNAEKIDLLVLILSSEENVERRKAIRQTWLSSYVNNTGTVRHLFLLGLSEYIENDVKIEKENVVHRDVLQGDFIEDYQNLTYKSLMGLRWGVEKCSKARLIAKVDDDVWLNIDAVLHLLKYGPLPFAVGGKCQYGIKPVRNPDTKWYASFQSFPEAQYPPFCVGPGYIVTMNAASKLIAVSENVPYFHLEDVYIGMCLQQLNLRVKNVYGFITVPLGGHICRHSHPTIILVHGLTPEVMRVISSRCRRSYRKRPRPVLGINVRPQIW